MRDSYERALAAALGLPVRRRVREGQFRVASTAKLLAYRGPGPAPRNRYDQVQRAKKARRKRAS